MESIRKEQYFIDRFEINRPSGQVVGNPGSEGVIRKGVDKEKVIGIDNGALRIEPTLHEGWGRTGIAYGPYQRENGLTFAVSLINGHNTSQAGSLDMPLLRRMKDWIKGSQIWSPKTRLIQWLRYPRKGRTIRMWRRWWEIYRRVKNNQVVKLDENLALGWFPGEVPVDPRVEGNSFIVHATGPENGELWARVNTENSPLIRGLQNVPLFYIIVLRERGAAYYAATVPDTPYLPAYPMMRPLAIDAFNQDPMVYAGLFQGVSGQIGFRADTRVREVQVTKEPTLSTWYGSAHAADRMSGDGSLVDFPTDTGDHWMVLKGGFKRTLHGCVPVEQDNLAILKTGSQVGLIHLLVQHMDNTIGSLRLIWRFQDENNYWSWKIGPQGSQLLITYQGETSVLAQEDHPDQNWREVHSLQIQDDGSKVQLYLNGKRVCACKSGDTRLQEETTIGISYSGTDLDLSINSLEVHPRSLPVPGSIQLSPPWVPCDQRVVVAQDCFDGPFGDLAGRSLPFGEGKWQRDIGKGVIEVTGQGCAAVRANAQNPNPGRTVYMIPWEHENNADLELDFIPPGTGTGQNEKSRIGLIFYQDEDNYVTVSTFMDDYYDGSSFAFFYHLNGFEEIYDAIWSNVGRAIRWGSPATARVVLEGTQFAVYINGEAVLYRSLTDVYPDVHAFKIRKVGIVVNWEWGDDTGTILTRFIAAKTRE